MYQQKGHLQERRIFGQVLNAVSAINENTLFSINETDPGIGDRDPAKPRIFNANFFRHGIHPFYIDWDLLVQLLPAPF